MQMSHRRRAKILNLISKTEDCSFGDAKKMLSGMSSKRVEALNLKISANSMEPISAYGIKMKLENLVKECHKRGIVAYMSKHNRTPVLSVEGVDVSVVYFANTGRFKMFSRGKPHIESEFPDMIMNELDILAYN